MSWRTIVVSNTSKLDYQLGFMVVRGEETVRVHINEIEMLIIESTAVSLTAYLMNELIKNKVKVIFCDEKRNPSSELLPYYGSHDTSAKIRHQIDWTRDIKAAVWTEIVTDKIRKQAEHLLDLNKPETKLLNRYIEEMAFGDETNREGHAAKVYFNALFGKDFTRTEDNPTNAALNYGYSLILSQFSREIVSNGYITQIGLFHDNMFNQFNLACDLMEPYRPIIDRMVVEMQPKQFEIDEKHQMLTVFNKELIIDGKKELLAKAVKIYARSVFDALNDQDISLIKNVFIMSFRYMRVIVMFDLPVTTSKGRKEYTRFRKYLIKSGFMMLQESIYCKLATNDTAAETIISNVRTNKPEKGLVQVLRVTEKQFARMEYIVGEPVNGVLDSSERIVFFMKLVNAELFLEIDIQENMPAVLVLERPDMMALVVKELYDLSSAGEGDFVLSMDSKEVSFEKTAEIIINPFSVDFNSRKIQSKLYEELLEGCDIYVEEKSMIQSLTIDYLDKLMQNVSYEMITSNIELDLLRLFRMYDVRLEPQCNSVLETLIEYTKVLSRLLRKKFLILINICNYLDIDAVKELARMCAYQKLNLLLIECGEINVKFPVKTYIIDKDKCLIIK